MSDSRHQVLRALNGVAHTPTTGAIVFALSAEIVSLDLIGNPELARSIATAWARDGISGIKQTAERVQELRREDAQRIAGILGTDQGPRLLFGGPAERNFAAREAVHDDQTITADVMKSAGGSDAARIPLVADGMARALVSAAIDKHVPMSDSGCGDAAARKHSQKHGARSGTALWSGLA